MLDAFGFEHLDISELRSRERIITRTLSRWCFDRGAAGIIYRSNLDNNRCVALFEGRASVDEDGTIEPLTAKPTELLSTCEEFGLSLGGPLGN
jgi:hypothetical protein